MLVYTFYDAFACARIRVEPKSYVDAAHLQKRWKYQEFAMRNWPEVLPALGIDPASLTPCSNPVNLDVLALMGDKGPLKGIALAR